MIETWGLNRRELRGKLSKHNLLQILASKLDTKQLDLGTMSVKDLRAMAEMDKPTKINTDHCKTKTEFITELKKAYPRVVQFEKASLTGLKDLAKCLKT